MKIKYLRRCLVVFSALVLMACSPGNPVADEATRNDKACQVPPVFKANGQHFRQLATVNGYRDKGQAVLYGNAADGRSSSNCETIDLQGFTAAHRTLPLPSYVKLTNTSTRKSVVVKVNNRGPVSGNALIQVTPAVAGLLGARGAFPVEIEALSANNTRRSSNNTIDVKKATARAKPVPNRSVRTVQRDRYYIVLGTYEDQGEALDQFIRISSIGLPKAAMESQVRKGRILHMVRLGPFYRQDEIDLVKDRLKNDGLVKFRVVKN